MSGVRLLGRYLAAAGRSQLEYRASFILTALADLILMAGEFAGLLLLFDRFGSLRGWTLPEVALLYGMVHVSHGGAEILAAGFDRFGQLVRMGDFDRMLLRPRSTAMQLAGHDVSMRKLGRVLQGAAVLAWAAWRCHVPFTAAKALLLVWALAGGGLVFYGLFVLQATMAFWTVESLELMNTLTYGGREAGQFPISIYWQGFRRFFTFVVPLACANYYPALTLLDRADPLGGPLWVGWLAPVAGILFLAVCMQTWRFGVRHYRSTGS